MENIEPLDPALVAQVAFGKKVRDRRLAAEWTQKELAERVTSAGTRMQQGTIAKIENGSRPTSVGEAAVLASAMKTTPASLLDSSEWEPDGLSAYLGLAHSDRQFRRAVSELRLSWERYWAERRDVERHLAEAETCLKRGVVGGRELSFQLGFAASGARRNLELDLNDVLEKTNERLGMRAQIVIDQEAP